MQKARGIGNLTCWYAWKQRAARRDLRYTCFTFNPCNERNYIEEQDIKLKKIPIELWFLNYSQLIEGMQE